MPLICTTDRHAHDILPFFFSTSASSSLPIRRKSSTRFHAQLSTTDRRNGNISYGSCTISRYVLTVPPRYFCCTPTRFQLVPYSRKRKRDNRALSHSPRSRQRSFFFVTRTNETNGQSNWNPYLASTFISLSNEARQSRQSNIRNWLTDR